MNRLLFIIFLFFGSSVSIFGHELKIEIVMPIDNDQAITVMDDRSVWKTQFAGRPYITVGNNVTVENYDDPKVGQNYSWAYGYYQGFDEIWTVIRKTALLLSRDFAFQESQIPYSAHKETFFIKEIIQFDNKELITLNNGTILIMPPQHAGNAVGDLVQLQVMSNGTTAYLTRQLDDAGGSVMIAMHRNSTISFVAY